MTRPKFAGSTLALALASALLIAGCAQAGNTAQASTPPPPAPEQAPMVPAPLQEAVQAALKDAATRSGRDAASLKVTLAEEVTWPNGALGCPMPGRMYTQALVPGYRIRIAAGSQTLEYHGGRQGAPSYCPAERLTPSLPGSPTT